MNIGLIGSVADQAGAESIRLPELEPYPVDRGTKLRVAGTFGEQLEDSLFLAVQPSACPGGQLREDVARRFLRALDALAPFARAQVAGVYRLIDDVQAQVVVNEAFGGIDLGVDARPEFDGRLELRGSRKELVLSIRMKREEGEGVGYR